jgi:hypothetical protein
LILDVEIKGVTFRDVTKKADGKQIRIFEVEDQNGIKWTTSRQDIANEAFRRVGQMAQIQGREEQNGAYLNRYLDMVSEPGVLTPPPSQEFPIPGVVQSALDASLPRAPMAPTPPPAPIPPSAPAQPTIQPSGPTEHDWQIWRQVAAKVSATVSTTAPEFWSNLDDLVRYFAYGTKPSYVPGDAPRFIPEGAIQESNAEGPPPYTDDDIPF